MSRFGMVAMVAALALALAVPAPAVAQGPPEHAQGKGKGQQAERGGPDRDRGPQEARSRGKGQGAASARRGPAARRGGSAPSPEVFNRRLPERAARARARRAPESGRVRVEHGNGEVRFIAEDGGTLFRLDEAAAGSLGYWRAAVVPPARDDDDREWPRDDRDRDGGIFGTGDRYPDDEGRRAGSPSFCRSGAGHPVWGRDWCLDKGFGLGDGRGAWGVDRDIEDIILRPDPDRDVVDPGRLIDILGDIVFGRLALQSVVLGADEPLSGRWIGERDGPRVLRVQAGDLPVAELVDDDRDDRIDRILFNLGG